MSTRICKKCQREFQPSSNHKMCPGCRHQANKTPCIKCGKPSGRKYIHCAKCKPTPPRKPYIRIKGKGYLMERIPEHPRAHCNSGYVFQHILVMEQKIGRYLVKGETVHHINGVKDDNRPGNLELWATNQPSGQRARDLLDWAREIIFRYEPMESVL